MSSDIVVRATSLSKRYHLYDKPGDRLRQLLWRGKRSFYRDFSALDDVNFEMRRGETMGVLGRNGAGKSTLLQLLCGTVTPTSGTIEVNGRVAALLELGAGFNPEFSGRDNVYLNAAILGMKHEQIAERFDDIAAFADIGAFIDQPVKTYSSGMYMRLAFSVAVHVDPDILIVDEALAVGDAPFQAKCINRIRRMIDSGVSLLYVSHDLSSTKILCSRALLLDKGRQLALGLADDVADEYAKIVSAAVAQRSNLSEAAPEDTPPAEGEKTQRLERYGDGKARYVEVQTLDADGKPRESFFYGETLRLRARIEVRAPLKGVGCGFHLRDRNGIDIAYSDTVVEGIEIGAASPGEILELEWSVPLEIANGLYHFSVVVSAPRDDVLTSDFTARDVSICDFVAMAAHFQVGGDTLLFGYFRTGKLESVRRIVEAKGVALDELSR